MYKTLRIRHINNHRRTILVFHLLHGQILEVLCLVISNLLTFRRKCLSEIAVTIQETNCGHIHVAVRSFFEVVTS